MTDIDGRWRHLSIPVGRLTEETCNMALVLMAPTMDMLLWRAATWSLYPIWILPPSIPLPEVPTLTMIGDVMIIDRPANRPFDQYPRNVAKRAIGYMKELGIADEMIVGPEYEFYIFDRVEYTNRPECSGYDIAARQAEWSTENNGYQVPKKAGYHTSLPMDVTQDLRNRICLMMEDWGVKVKYHHPEVGGCGQLEIEVELGEMTQMADNTMVAKYIIKNAAAKEGRTATFMPKPVAGEAGSGMHVHMHLFKDGEPIFYDETGYAQLSDVALWFIGGMLEHASSLCAITNPSTNSYKRLVPGFEAPVTIGYAMANRSAVVRIPAYAKAPKNKRFELRNPDATCNPYYAFAAHLDGPAWMVSRSASIPTREAGGPVTLILHTL